MKVKKIQIKKKNCFKLLNKNSNIDDKIYKYHKFMKMLKLFEMLCRKKVNKLNNLKKNT